MSNPIRAIADADDRRLAGASEDQIHASILAWLQAALPWPASTTIHHSPNGGLRAPKAGAKLKALGARPGWPDLSFICDGATYYLEVKKEGGRLSKAQVECHRDIRMAGAKVETVRSIEDARETLERWGIETRESA